MRIALTHAFSWPEVRRGGERLVAELARHLGDAGDEVEVLSSGFARGVERHGGVTIRRYRRWRQDDRAAEADFGRRVLPRLLAGRYDVVHSFGRRDGVASLRARRLHPRRVLVHTDIGNPSRAWWSRQGRELAFQERVIREVDAYGCMSRLALGMLQDDWGREGVLLPGGVDLAAFTPRPRASRPSLLFAGAFEEPRKGVAALLAALPIVAATHPDVELWLSGSGDPTALLAAAPAAARERTRFLGLGATGDLPDLYGRAWCGVLPSVGDTFGLTLIEALAAGTPVVAADRDALPELVDPGRTGALCEPDDPTSIAAACVAALALAEQAGTAAACRAAAAPFDWRTAVAPRHRALYASLAAERPSTSG